MKQSEVEKRNKLQREKPYVYEKVLKFKEKVERGESIAIIQFQYNFDCNFRCEHCSIKGFQHKHGRSLTLDNVKDLSQQADALGLARFVITGGEPLIFKDFDELVKAIDPSKFSINCDTNGWFLDLKRARHLKSVGIDGIQLSVDSLDEKEHDRFRNKTGSWARAMAAAQASLDAELNIFVQTVVTRTRLHSQEFIEFLKHFNNMGIGVFVTFGKPVGAWEGHFEDLITKEDLQYFQELEKSYNVFCHLTPGYGINEERHCIGGRNIFSITQYGDVLICPYFHCSFGNILDEPLKDILARCLKATPFQTNTCPLAEDRNFIDKYLVTKIYGKELPVSYKNVFEGDFK